MRMRSLKRGILSPPFDPQPQKRLGVTVEIDTTGVETMKQEPDYVSVPKAAEMLGCTDVWVIRLIKDGRLDAFRLSGRAWAVRRASVQRNLQEYMQRAPALSGRKRSKIG